MKYNYKNQKSPAKKLFDASLVFIAAIIFAIPSFADADTCDGSKYRVHNVTYLESSTVVNSDSAFDSRCHYYTNSHGQRICQIRMRGSLFVPLASAYNVPDGQAKFPAIVVNHGSEHFFYATPQNNHDGSVHLCRVSEYFVQEGYIVFAPFRRGQGDSNDATNRSTGIYVEDMVADFQSATPVYPHNTACTLGDCYRSQLLAEQADEDVRAAMDWLKLRSDVKPVGGDSPNYRLAIMGISYGGRVTVYSNALNLGQLAAVAFSPAAEGWGGICQPNDLNCGSFSRQTLMAAARNADKSAFYLQARWDYDTRPTTDLAYAHATGSYDYKHQKPYRSAIYAYKNPCPDHPCTDENYQSIHAGFFGDPDVWGPAVTDFLRRNGVR